MINAMHKIHFMPDDAIVDIQEGETIRDAALRHSIPITNVCGAKGRCSTCRVMVVEGLENCSSRSDKEKDIAGYMSFTPEIRLACQTTTTGDLQVRRLTLDQSDIELTSKFIMGDKSYLAGVEKHIFIMFVDIRKFTAFSETLLPYDVVHILHRFFHIMDRVVKNHGGYIDNYMGDGFMALFEADDPEQGALSAVKSGLEMLDALNNKVKPYVEKLFGRSFEMGIGLHYGLVVAGTVGGSDDNKTTVIGDAVNFASRIESANKQINSRFLISKDTYTKIENSVRVNRIIQIEIPGKTGVQTLYEIVGIN
jgi:adenylate cyclase